MNLGVRAKFFLVTVSLVIAVDLAAGTYLQWKLRADHEAGIVCHGPKRLLGTGVPGILKSHRPLGQVLSTATTP